MTTVEVFAPAKVNLTLHVTGRRDDGYHQLDSLVVFADIGDTIRAESADLLTLHVEGPEARGLADEADNLVLRAGRALAPGRGAAVTLVKRLPVAAGIGGGSADAAATLKALSDLWGCPMPGPAETAHLGADVPVCVAGKPARMRGIGEALSALPTLPDMDILLVNPRVAVPTARIFANLASPDNPPMPDPLPDWPDAGAFGDWLAKQRNDLIPPAQALAPDIAGALQVLRACGGLAHGMSGSGATCYALFPAGESAAPLDRIRAAHPHWWSVSARIL